MKTTLIYILWDRKKDKQETLNKVTGTVKEWIQQVIDGNRKRFEKDLLALEPAERVKAISGLICYVLPKQQSVSIQEQINAEYDALERLIENAPDEAIDKITEKILKIREDKKYGQ